MYLHALCVCACVHVPACACVCVCMHPCVWTCVQKCAFQNRNAKSFLQPILRMMTSKKTCVCVHVCACIQVCEHVCTNVHVCISKQKCQNFLSTQSYGWWPAKKHLANSPIGTIKDWSCRSFFFWNWTISGIGTAFWFKRKKGTVTAMDTITDLWIQHQPVQLSSWLLQPELSPPCPGPCSEGPREYIHHRLYPT